MINLNEGAKRHEGSQVKEGWRLACRSSQNLSSASDTCAHESLVHRKRNPIMEASNWVCAGVQDNQDLGS